MTYVFIYRMTSDTGFAPCVDNDLLTLACCKGGQIRNGKPRKTGLRYHIGSKRNGINYLQDKVYIIGTYRDKFLYMALITDVMTMKEYFTDISNGRTDNIYDVKDNNIIRNGNLQSEKIHIDELQNIRDVAGEYVLLSDDFIYLGKDAVLIDILKKYGAVYCETKIYDGDIAEQIVAACKNKDDKKKHKPINPLKTKCGGK